MENLKGLIDDEKDIYTIDNKAASKYDFQRLNEAIAKGLPAEKKESFVDSLYKLTHATIRIKANLLKGKLPTKLYLTVSEHIQQINTVVKHSKAVWKTNGDRKT